MLADHSCSTQAAQDSQWLYPQTEYFPLSLLGFGHVLVQAHLLDSLSRLQPEEALRARGEGYCLVLCATRLFLVTKAATKLPLSRLVGQVLQHGEDLAECFHHLHSEHCLPACGHRQPTSAKGPGCSKPGRVASHPEDESCWSADLPSRHAFAEVMGASTFDYATWVSVWTKRGVCADLTTDSVFLCGRKCHRCKLCLLSRACVIARHFVGQRWLLYRKYHSTVRLRR